MIDEMVVANQQAAHRKQERVRKDKAIDQQVLRYQRRKAKKERLAEEAEIARRVALEKETARLRALQERATDEKAQEDAERAKKHREQVILRDRAKAKKRADERRRAQEEVSVIVAQQLVRTFTAEQHQLLHGFVRLYFAPLCLSCYFLLVEFHLRRRSNNTAL